MCETCSDANNSFCEILATCKHKYTGEKLIAPRKPSTLITAGIVSVQKSFASSVPSYSTFSEKIKHSCPASLPLLILFFDGLPAWKACYA